MRMEVMQKENLRWIAYAVQDNGVVFPGSLVEGATVEDAQDCLDRTMRPVFWQLWYEQLKAQGKELVH